MEINDNIQQLLQKIEERYKQEGQPVEGYLEGLLYTEYLDYWHYINLDALLALQHPKTYVKDEMIFIVYHQITELYFKLCLWEYDQILNTEAPSAAFLKERIRRIINYFTNLTHSFDIMVDGMEQSQFLKFRLALLPASGFQSAQYRMIEIASTDLINLVHPAEREKTRNGSVEDQYEYIYWKYGATVAESGVKTLTLKRFEEKYADSLTLWAKDHEKKNLLTVYRNLPTDIQQDTGLINAYKELDTLVNVSWPLVHFKSAVRYLKPETSETVAATGGTNWEKYLPPRFQRRIFFPELWTEDELGTWGTGKTL
jgi:tryptophan 2,3-dioxygenase